MGYLSLGFEYNSKTARTGPSVAQMSRASTLSASWFLKAANQHVGKHFARISAYVSLPPIKYSYQCYCVCLSWIWKSPPSSWCSLWCDILVARNADSGGTKRNRTFVPISSQKPDILIQVIVTSIFNWTDKCACWIYSCVEAIFSYSFSTFELLQLYFSFTFYVFLYTSLVRFKILHGKFLSRCT